MQFDMFPVGYELPPIYPRGNAFYRSDEWLALRYEVLKDCAGKCQLCGQRPKTGNPLQVDHIKPRSRWPWLAYDINNLQVLCRDCNLGKSNRDDTDWRDVCDANS